jgi:hypothetical protein
MVYRRRVRRATITIPDELEADLEAYRSAQEVAPSLAAITQTALRQFLREPAPGAGLIERVLRHRSAIKTIARRHGVTAIYLFGSVARGDARAISDVDLAVEVVGGTTLFDLARLRVALVELLHTDVDVVPLRGLADSIRPQFDAEAIEL